MFEALRRSFPRDPLAHLEGGIAGEIPDVLELRDFFTEFGGTSFRGGLYRAIHPADLSEWKSRICLAFPLFSDRVTCFGYDWLGRTFAIDPSRLEGRQPSVIMFEPGTGEVLEIPSNLQTFHDVELVEFGEAALAISYYGKWLAAGGAKPKYLQCVGYKKPLFLGGRDEVDNLEMSDLDVYWHLMGQLISKTRGLPKGTPVKVRLDQS